MSAVGRAAGRHARDDGVMDDAVQTYIDAISPANRPLFDRLHGLILEVRPDVEVVISYQMPTYVAGDHRFHVGAWKHGLSLYGWDAGQDGGFVERHPDLAGDKGTIRLSPAAAAGIADDELRGLVRGALGG
jgi:hypothetical protein